MYDEFEKDATFLRGHLTRNILLDKFQTQDRKTWVGCWFRDVIQKDFYQMDPQLSVWQLFVSIFAKLVCRQDKVFMLNILHVTIVLEDTHCEYFK